ncbi:trypco2 family protein [Streptomyces sp. NPDC086549]|uniref:trypco2 family protein n=1 Tax=Streptomyces sp. NPDC086549 TaxID=3365752 RepID=UPI003822ACDC
MSNLDPAARPGGTYQERSAMGNGHSQGEDWLDLADAITLLRDQIAEAQFRIASPNGTDARHQGVLFTLGEITLDLGMELAHTRGINGGLRFSVVGIGGKKETADKATHTVTVRLKPHQPGGRDVEVSDKE